MHAAEIVTYIAGQGFTLDFVHELGILSIHPAPPSELAKRIIANESVLVEYFRSLPMRPATNHKFTVREGARNTPDDSKRFGVCLRCGIPWHMHGKPPVEVWAYVEKPDYAALVDACPIEIPSVLTAVA